jgi:membrane-bound lytic murein transglycosylase D
MKEGLLIVMVCLFGACTSTTHQSSGIDTMDPSGEVVEAPRPDAPDRAASAHLTPADLGAVSAEDAAKESGVERLNPAAALETRMSSSLTDVVAGPKTAEEELATEEVAKDPQMILDEALEFCEASRDFWSKGDFDNAIASLDEAYSLLLEADTKERPRLIQQKEEIRFVICKRMLEIYASQRTAVNGNHNAIPTVMNEHVEKEIKRFQGPERRFFLASYKRSGKFRPFILKALKEAGIPEELSWLPLIESGFKVRALSRARALGLWQFIPSTGYKFGLTRDRWVDERMDMAKSTRAAIAYLKELHNIFGDWSTVLAAYNCGEFRVLRLIRNQNINYLDDFWDLFRQLPWETARYVPRFLAALHIINDPEKYGFDLGAPDPPLAYEVVEVSSKQVRLADAAESLGVLEEDMQLLNAELRYKVTPPKAYKLKVPQGYGATLTAKLEDIPAYVPPRRYYAYHRVRRGETLSHLARRYHTSVRAIMEANNLRSANYVRVGQKLKIPARWKSRTYVLARQAAEADSSKSLHHRVKRGDSLWLLARAYNTNIREIMRLNNLTSTRLHVGQVLVVRQGVDEAMLEGTRSYRVKKGDSPYRIATLHNMELERFLRINQLTPRSKIYPGQTLLVDAK